MSLCCFAGPAAIEVNASTAVSQTNRAAAPIRCYKLNKKRRSYNVVSVNLSDESGRTATVQQCIHTTAMAGGPQAEESSITFQLELTGRSLLCRLFLVHDAPQLGDAESEGASGTQHAWRLVQRAQCAKGCEGPLLATSRRLSSLGKRMLDGSASAPPAAAKPGAPAAQDLRHMYVSIDEACTHVGASAFRLVAAIYDGASHTPDAPVSSGAHSAAGESAAERRSEAPAQRQAAGRLLATTMSPPIKVLANNDAPTGAGRIPLEATLPADWDGWADLATWASQGCRGSSADGSLPSAGTPMQSHSLVHRNRDAPSVAPRQTGSAVCRATVQTAASPAATATAGSASACPGAVACCAGSAPSNPAAASLPALQPTACLEPSQLPANLTGISEPLLPTAASATGTAPPPNQPVLDHCGPDTGATAAAATAARRQQQRVRQAMLSQSSAPPLPTALPLGSRCTDLASQLRAAAAARQTSHQPDAAAAAGPLSAQSAAAAAGPRAGAEAMVEGGSTGAPAYRVVRPRHLPPASASPFAARRGALPESASYGGEGVLAAPGVSTLSAHTPWHAQAPPQSPCPTLPPAVDCTPTAAASWTDLQSSASTEQQGASLLPPDAYEVKAVVAEAAPAAAAWPLQRKAVQPAGCTAVLINGSAYACSRVAAAAHAGWDAMQWAAYQSAAARHADSQLVAAGLAAAGRLGLLPSAACRLSPAPQPAQAFQQAPLLRLSARGMQAPGPVAGAGMPNLPADAQLTLMGDSPHEMESLVAGSIFDDILPREQ